MTIEEIDAQDYLVLIIQEAIEDYKTKHPEQFKTEPEKEVSNALLEQEWSYEKEGY